uniref:Uncharacterized protein n=1 Tax=Vitis vinifera TaxID=29760 RepID=F6HZJ2_VITVI
MMKSSKTTSGVQLDSDPPPCPIDSRALIPSGKVSSPQEQILRHPPLPIVSPYNFIYFLFPYFNFSAPTIFFFPFWVF